MKKLCALLASAVLAAAVIPAASPGEQMVSAADKIKIMPVGDSITYGMGENGGYRKYLYDALKKDGYDIDMVGPEGSNSASANGITYDDNHAGYSGYQIKEEPSWAQQQGTSGSLYNTLKQKNAVKQYQPDIILLIIGTNDMTANRSMDACASDLRAVVDYMLGDMPSGGVIFMGSIPEFTAYGGNAQRVANYNNTVKSVAEEYAKSGKNVKFADVHGSLNGTADLGSDNLHPNGTGYKKMGNFWAETVENYLKNGSGSTTPSTTEPPSSTPSDDPPLSGSELLHATFESGLSGWEGRSATVEVSSAEAASGSKSAEVSGRSDAWNGIAYDISSLCFAGTNINVSAKIKQKSGSSVKFKLTVQYGSGNSAEYDTFAQESIASGEWGTISAAGYTVKSGSSPVLYIETDTDKCDFYVDEIIISKASGGGSSTTQTADYKLGDVNGNGSITAADLSLAKMYAKGSLTDKTQKKMADVNCDGSVDQTDVEWFVKYLTVQEKELPEALTPPQAEMRTMSEYTPECEKYVKNNETQESRQTRQGVQYGTIKKEYYRSKKANKDKPYNIMLPAGYSTDKKYPVLYILHGFFENEDRMILTGNNNQPMVTKQIVGNAIADGEAVDMIVVSPFVFTHPTMNDATGFADQGSNQGYDNFVDDIVDSLMPHIESKYSVATGRENTAVTGFSMGGRESLQIGMKYGDKFGYLGAICPAPGASGSWKWSSEKEAPSVVMITGGTQDDVVGLNTPEGYHNNFDKNGVPHIWHVVQGGHHGDDSIHSHLYAFVRMVFKA